jgi:hypothetical protein
MAETKAAAEIKAETDPRVLLLDPSDPIAVAARPLSLGDSVIVGGRRITIGQAIDTGHKFAVRAIAPGERVLKYRCPIGSATALIQPGQLVHTHNLASDYLPTYTLGPAGDSAPADESIVEPAK